MEQQQQQQQQLKHQVHKPRLEIPDPTKLSGSSSSPRSMHGFPQSPQTDSPSEVKSFEDWSSPQPLTADTTTTLNNKVVDKKCLTFYAGEFVLVRCNHSKWLLGQVRRSSKTGVIVWVEAAQTLVNVPYDLLASHLVKLDGPSSQPPSSSLSSTMSDSTVELTRSGQLMAPFQCVRPAHLSHRKLYQPLRLNSLNSGVNLGVNLGSASLPGNLQIVKKTETFYDRVSPLHSSVCLFKFPQEQEGSFMNRFGGTQQQSSDGDWITVIENGLDVRRKPAKH